MSIFTERKIDCHNHIFDPLAFPYQENAPYKPSGHEITTADYFTHVLDSYGVSHALIVGPNSGYGEDDNRALLDAITRSNGRFKGMAVVSKDVSDQTLLDLKNAGIVGVTFNISFYGTDHFHYAEELLHRLKKAGLIAQFQFSGDELLPFYDLILNSPVKIIIDHAGRPDLDNGLKGDAFEKLLNIGHSTKHLIKLSGMAKFSKCAFPFEDTKDYILSLHNAFGEDRVLWGSDWPFLLAPQRMDYGPLLHLYENWFPDPIVRDKLLWANAAREFGLVKSST